MAEGFANSIIGGAETLIRSAIKSVNYVLGLAGWRISRDGDAEFNDATIRGSVIAGGGTVTLNNLGVFVIDDNSVQQYVILRDGGFVARNSPDDGQHTQMFVVGLAISAPTVSAHGFASTDARFDAFEVSAGVIDFMQANIVTGSMNGQSDANILLRSEGSDGVNQPYIQLDATALGTIELLAEFTNVAHRLISTDTGMDYPAAQLFSTTMVIAADGTLAAAKGATNYPTAFPAGSTLYGSANITAGPGQLTQMHVRFLPVSDTQYNLVWYRPAAVVGSAGFVIPIDVTVFVIPA